MALAEKFVQNKRSDCDVKDAILINIDDFS